MKVTLDLRIGIIAHTKAAAETFARVAGIPRAGWFYAYPDTMRGASNVIFMKAVGWEKRRDAAEIDRMLAGCYIAFEWRVIAAMQAAATVEMGGVTTAMIDAAMVEMKNLHPPMRRSECERFLRAALAPATEAAS
ncbi:hypothetical protein [Bosea sp. ASV33]|uniref:hypothetical protein n=1 Tax=Bosea sp. ASV33 TaxID=2795106 RepID=UPI0018ED131D|nr:hypothetical protein [Bosea sp. ASV33]